MHPKRFVEITDKLSDPGKNSYPIGELQHLSCKEGHEETLFENKE